MMIDDRLSALDRYPLRSACLLAAARGFRVE
jgi:hypothetical protein